MKGQWISFYVLEKELNKVLVCVHSRQVVISLKIQLVLIKYPESLYILKIKILLLIYNIREIFMRIRKEIIVSFILLKTVQFLKFIFLSSSE